jgi:hypothetical protein
MGKKLENPEKNKRRKQPSRPTKPSEAARPRCLTGGPRLSAAVPLSHAPSLSRSLPSEANLSAPVTSPALSLFCGPDSPVPSRCPRASPFLSLHRGPTFPAPAVDRRVRTRARRRVSRPRRPPTRPAPFLEPRQCPTHTPHLISLGFTLSHALPTPLVAARDPRPRSRPSSSPETAPSLPELRPEVRHPSMCPISPSPVLDRGGPPCSRGDRPI